MKDQGPTRGQRGQRGSHTKLRRASAVIHARDCRLRPLNFLRQARKSSMACQTCNISMITYISWREVFIMKKTLVTRAWQESKYHVSIDKRFTAESASSNEQHPCRKFDLTQHSAHFTKKNTTAADLRQLLPLKALCITHWVYEFWNGRDGSQRNQARRP